MEWGRKVAKRIAKSKRQPSLHKTLRLGWIISGFLRIGIHQKSVTDVWARSSFVRRLGPFRNSLHDSRQFGLPRHFTLRQLCAPVASRPTYKAIKSNFADSINLLLHIERKNGHRYVSQLLEVRGYDVEADKYDLLPLYQKSQAFESPVRATDGSPG